MNGKKAKGNSDPVIIIDPVATSGGAVGRAAAPLMARFSTLP